MAHGINKKQVWMIFVYLLVLTILEVAIAKVDISVNLLVSGLVVMAIAKAALVALFYMHLKHETNLVKWSVAIPMAIPVFYAAILVSEATWRMFG